MLLMFFVVFVHVFEKIKSIADQWQEKSSLRIMAFSVVENNAFFKGYLDVR